MAERNKSLSCPVCADGMLQIEPSEKLELALDYCDECGGMWFESGEVRQLRECPPEVLSGLITVKKQLYAVHCSSCNHSMTRNVAECPSCGHANTIDCPVCDSELARIQSDHFTVDVCRDCRGVWFDNIDLSQVWNLQFDRSTTSTELAEITGEPSVDTVVAILRYGQSDDGAQDGSRNVFGMIADIVGEIVSPAS